MDLSVGTVLAFNRENYPYQLINHVEYSPADKEQYRITDIYADGTLAIESVRYPTKVIGWLLNYRFGNFYYRRNIYHPEEELERMMEHITDTQMDYIPFDDENYENDQPEVTSAYREYYPIHDIDV
jgi:hypothetical protein